MMHISTGQCYHAKGSLGQPCFAIMLRIRGAIGLANKDFARTKTDGAEHLYLFPQKRHLTA